MGLFNEKASPAQTAPAERTSTIAPGTTITGDLSGADHVRLEGILHGNVTCRQLTIGESGELCGEAEGDEVVVHGTLRGVIRAKRVTLGPSAKVYGDVDHEVLEVEAGAEVEGRYTRAMQNAKPEKGAGSDKAAIVGQAGPMQKVAPPQSPRRAPQSAAKPAPTEIPDANNVTKH